MRLVYTLIASGLLVMTDVTADQPPLIPYDATFYRVEMAQVVTPDSQKSLSFSLDSYLDLDLPSYWFNPQGVEPQSRKDGFEPRKPPQLGGRHIQDGPLLRPETQVPTLTPLPTTLLIASPAIVSTSAPTAAPLAAPSATALPRIVQDESWLAFYYQPSPLPISGLAMYYNANVMQEVLSNRLKMGHVSACSECIGNVALLRAGDLNRRVWLQWADGAVEGPFLVADVAAPHHVAHLLARNWVVDVDYRTAVRRGIIGPVQVTVWAAPPQGNPQATPPFAPLYASTPAPTPTLTPIPTLTPFPSPTLLPLVSQN